MPQFMLLLHDNPADWQKVSPEEMQSALEKYMSWAQLPFMVDAKRLAGEPGRVIRAGRVTDGPYSETKEVFGGYFLIEAADYNEAVERALTHPHVQYGTIEVRQLHPSEGAS